MPKREWSVRVRFSGRAGNGDSNPIPLIIIDTLSSAHIFASTEISVIVVRIRY